MEDANKTLYQLKDKETDEDLRYDTEQLERNGIDNYVPMTTRKEVIAWWLFDWANSPTYGIALAFVFPVFLTLMATRYSCLNNTAYGCDWNDKPINSDYTLRVSLGNWQLRPESYASSMISLSSGFQAVAYIVLSGLADYGNYKTYLFRITAICAQIMNMSWIFFSSEEIWLFAGIWGALATIPFGLSLIFYNAFLLEIVENHWRLQRLDRQKGDIELMEKDIDNIRSPDALKAYDKETHQKTRKQLITTLQDDISEWGFACGYCGSVIVTLITVVMLFVLDDSKAYFEDNIGINNMNTFNKLTQTNSFYNNYSYEYNINNMTSSEEWYVLPVIEADIWYTVITIYEDLNGSMNMINQFSLINAMQLIYVFKNDKIHGGLYGNNNSLNSIKISDDNVITIDIESYHGIVNDIGDIKQFNVYENKNNGLIHAIQFNHDGIIFGITNNTKLIENKYNDFHLGGYEISNAFINMEFYDESLNINNMGIISGYPSIVFVHNDGQYGSTIALQLSYFMVGLWFFIFSIPAFIYLRKRIREPIPLNSSPWTISIKRYYKTFKKAKKYPDLFKYLITWFLFSDALSTTGSCGILFGQIELGMASIQLVLLLIEVELFAVIGAFFFVWLQKKLKWNARQMLLLHLSIMAFLPFYAVFGVIEGAKLGLVNIWEMYVFVAIYGFNQGSIQALSRSMYGQFIPSGCESQFFGLYEITDKGSSWIGPMMVAIVSNYTSMRWALFYIVGFYLISLPLLYFGVDYERGIKRAKLNAFDDSKSVISHTTSDHDENNQNTNDINNNVIE